MREIGGYIELDTYHLPMLHEDAIALNCGRNALAWLIRARKINRLWIPKLICDSVTGVCEREGISYSFYSIGMDFCPAQEVKLGEGEWFYFVNYYSQFDNDRISEYVQKYKRIIVDNAQSYFQRPIPGIDSIYTCRKYFGVPDGAFLYTDAMPAEEYLQDESLERMHFLLGRFEKSATEFYFEYVENNKRFATEPIKEMSRLTRNLLHGINYEEVVQIRKKNFEHLNKKLNCINQLKLQNGTFMYPLLIDNGMDVRKKMQERRIYIPMLWPLCGEPTIQNNLEQFMAENILPLPIDQRYGVEDMDYIALVLKKCINDREIENERI